MKYIEHSVTIVKYKFNLKNIEYTVFNYYTDTHLLSSLQQVTVSLYRPIDQSTQATELVTMVSSLVKSHDALQSSIKALDER